AGKTVLSREIIAGRFPIVSKLCGSAPEDIPIRCDLRVLPADLPRDRVIIVECSTYNFNKLVGTEQWQRLLSLNRESEKVIFINLTVPKSIIVWQFFLRIFTGPKRVHVLFRILQLSKY